MTRTVPRLRACSLGLVAAALVLLLTPISAHAVPIRGLEYPQGALSFADSVAPDDFDPGPGTTNVTASNALGVPDTTEGGPFSDVSLGIGGTLILQFTDNLLFNGDGADLAIYEVGSAAGLAEAVLVSVSVDGSSWISIPTPDVLDDDEWVESTLQGTCPGSSCYRDPVLIDIGLGAGINPGDTFAWVRLIDYTGDPDSTGGTTFGADIDAVGAINSVPEPSTVLLLGLGLLGLAARGRREMA